MAAARKAIVLAAGAGRRLGPFSDAHPKPLATVNGTTILENCLARLAEAGMEEAVIVVGHLREQILAAAGQRRGAMRIRTIVAEDYATTNNIVSLWRAREELDCDVLLLEADIFFDSALLAAIQQAEGENIAAVARFTPAMNGAAVIVDDGGAIAALIEGKEQGPGFDYGRAFKTVNIWRLGSSYCARYLVPALERAIAEGRTGDYYEALFKADIARLPGLFRAVDCTPFAWYEIDDHEDRRAAEYLFRSDDEKLAFIAGEYGGYWRYGFADHCYIYNLHFPPAEMWRRVAEHLPEIARDYPVGQRALAKAAGDAFGLNPDHLTVANGASELIRIVCGAMGKRIVVPAPSFNEYENATPAELLTRFALPAPDFELDVAAFADAAETTRADIAIVVSPNNPTSLAVTACDLLRLAKRLERRGTILLLDESFVDFYAGEPYRSLLPEIAAQPNLAILKSLSKVYGAAGLRLGYLCTANAEFARGVRAALPIWNINGFAEAFLKHLPRYTREFRASCEAVRADRDALYQDLRAIPGGHAYPPQANFVFWRLPEGMLAPDLVRRLFVEHGILIKGCNEKTLPGGARHVRISARTAEENARAVAAIRSIVGG